jgi:hypothetical protein
LTQETAESQSNLVVLKTLEELRKSIRCSFRYDVQMSTPRDTTNMRTTPSFDSGLRSMRRGRINTHNPLPLPHPYGYIKVAPGYVRDAVEAYDNWTGNEQVPAKVEGLIMILRIELSRRYEARPRSLPLLL